jgi:hypothetical protein
MNFGSRGLYGTASIPGTGISIRQRLSGERQPRPFSASNDIPNSPSSPGFPNRPQDFGSRGDSNSSSLTEIRSASTELLTSESLKELKGILQMAYEEREEIGREVGDAKREKAYATARFDSWNKGFLFKRLLKKSFMNRKLDAETMTAKVTELEEQLRLTTISTQVELANEQAEPFFRMRDEFTALAECAAIWDIKAERATDKSRERTTASKAISRERVRFSLGTCDLIQWEQEVPHLQNATGGDIFLYPGFILYRASNMAFSVIDFHDVKIAASRFKFQEEDDVPADATIVGQTWAKTNKDGSRDKRFVGNHEIPIALYGDLALKSETGLWEEFQFSNPERLERFEKSWSFFVGSFEHRVSVALSQEGDVPHDTDSSAENSPRLVGADIHFECKCGQPVEVNAEAIGQEFRCPSCGEKLKVPQVANINQSSG